jgi:hypothetical protein
MLQVQEPVQRSDAVTPVTAGLQQCTLAGCDTPRAGCRLQVGKL